MKATTPPSAPPQQPARLFFPLVLHSDLEKARAAEARRLAAELLPRAS